MARCEHCLIEFPDARAVSGLDGRLFCCSGCAQVYAFIQDAGLGEFYDRRKWDDPGLPSAGVPEGFDGTAFLPYLREVDGMHELDIYVEGVHCATCVWLVERVLAKTPGVVYARMNYATHKARIRWNPGEIELVQVLGRVYASGYTPMPYSESEAMRLRQAETRDLLVRFGTAGFISSQLMIYSAAIYAGYFQGMDADMLKAFEMISFFLSLPVLFYSGLPIFLTGLRGILRLRFNMDSLIAIGSGSAFTYSVYGLFTGGKVFFDTAVMIITLILLGRLIESYAKGRAANTLDRLTGLMPLEAVVISDDGSRKRLPVSMLKTGMLVHVRPGEKFPADGAIEKGETEADESLLTGESRPVLKRSGSEVTGGSQNLFGSVEVRVSRTGPETSLAGIMRAVEDAQARKPRIQRVADRVVGVFVPVILLVSIATILAYLARGMSLPEAMMVGVSVLVIACPCSLGLATPLAVLVYTLNAYSHGLIIKSGDAAQNAARVRGVIFDKTGTLTTGSPELMRVLVSSEVTDSEALGLAASIESHSEHGLGQALVDAAYDRMEEFRPDTGVEGFKAAPGRGVSARMNNTDYLIGNLAHMKEEGATLRFTEEAGGAAGRGETPVFMARDGKVVALFLLADSLRPEASEAVSELKRMGLGVRLLSGDDRATTSALAERAGISEALGGILPSGKKDAVIWTQREGGVMMVGDGVNDAPALAASMSGVSMGSAADMAHESSDAVLVRNDLLLVPYFIRLSRRTIAIIWQNVFWAFFYNIVAIPLAVMGILHPIIAAGAMAASSLVVVANSLRLRSLRGSNL